MIIQYFLIKIHTQRLEDIEYSLSDKGNSLSSNDYDESISRLAGVIHLTEILLSLEIVSIAVWLYPSALSIGLIKIKVVTA